VKKLLQLGFLPVGNETHDKKTVGLMTTFQRLTNQLVQTRKSRLSAGLALTKKRANRGIIIKNSYKAHTDFFSFFSLNLTIHTISVVGYLKGFCSLHPINQLRFSYAQAARQGILRAMNALSFFQRFICMRA
jgi:hypothetical protein